MVNHGCSNEVYSEIEGCIMDAPTKFIQEIEGLS